MQKLLDFLHIKDYFLVQKEVKAIHRFDDSFLDNGMLPAGLLNITTDIYSLRALSWSRKEQFAETFVELEAVLG